MALVTDFIDYSGEGAQNYNVAITYYNNHLSNLLKNLNNKLNITNNNSSLKTEDLILEQIRKGGMNKFIEEWEKFYNSGINAITLYEAAVKYNKIIQKENVNNLDYLTRRIIMKDVLLDTHALPKELLNTMPETINTDDFIHEMEMLGNAAVGLKAKQYGGYKARAMGELFEAVSKYYAQIPGELINDFVYSTGRILNSNAKKIKPDAILTADVKLINELTSVNSTKGLSKKIDLEVDEVINLSEYAKNPKVAYNLITKKYGLSDTIGITMKMWTEKSSKKTFGTFSGLSQEDLDRAKIHSKKKTKRLYNYYAHSKYLLNILGATNSLMIGGSKGIEKTSVFLQGLLNTGRGIMAANDNLVIDNHNKDMRVKKKFIR